MNVKKPHIQKIPKKSEIDNLVSLNNKKDYVALEKESRILLNQYPHNANIQNLCGAALAGQSFFEESIRVFLKALWN